MAQLELDELFYNALTADDDLMTAVGGRIESTCFEVSPDAEDNTPLPCIIIMDDGFQGASDTKDDSWDSEADIVQASIEVDGGDPKEVKRLVRMVRKAIASYIASLEAQAMETPYLAAPPATNGVAWDWMKPCFHSAITYRCYVRNDLYDNGNN